MSHSLARSFNSYREQVDKTHSDMRGQVEQIKTNLGIDLTIRQVLYHPWANGMPTMDHLTYTKLRGLMLELRRNPKIQLNSLGDLNKIQIAVLEKMTKFLNVLQAAEEDSGLDVSNPGQHHIINIGRLAISSSSALMMKYCWIYWGDPKEEYYGRMPFTTPVKTYWDRNYGYRDPYQGDVDAVTHQVAAEIGWKAIDVNTAMWLMAQV